MGIFKSLFRGFQSYENLPSFQSLALERCHIYDSIDKLVDYYLMGDKVDASGMIKDPVDDEIYTKQTDALKARDAEICYVECLVEGKLIEKDCDLVGRSRDGGFIVCRILVEIPSNNPRVPSTLDISMSEREIGDIQMRYLKGLKLGQTVKIRGVFDGSANIQKAKFIMVE
jgi:hypothetical protein